MTLKTVDAPFLQVLQACAHIICVVVPGRKKSISIEWTVIHFSVIVVGMGLILLYQGLSSYV